MDVCDGASPLSLSDACVRESWAAVVPFTFVVGILASQVPPIRTVLRTLRRPFTRFLTLAEAEALLGAQDSAQRRKAVVPLWRTFVLSSVSLTESMLWVGLGCYRLIAHPSPAWPGLRDILAGLSWFYAALRPVFSPSATVPYDLLVLFIAHFVLGLVATSGLLYDSYIHAAPLSVLSLVANVANLVVIAGVLAIILNMPLALPSENIKEEDIGTTVSPEDYTTFWDWATFRWLMPLLDRGLHKTLNEEDVWSLSPIMRSQPLHFKFSQTEGTLVRRIWTTSRADLLVDFFLTDVGVVLGYAGPFFLKRILDALAVAGHSREQRALVCVYAFLAFACTALKAHTDVQRLFHSRRAGGRARSELMASIYEKALKRRDFSGIVAHEGAASTGASIGNKPTGSNEAKAGADIGKIVNLMAGDANRISGTIATLYFLNQAPFEIVLATIFLYQLLGVSAFMGIFILLLGYPLNKIVGKTTIEVQKGLSTARDKRMGILNELIGSVKFVKFFAWEDRWIDRVLEAREAELQWLVRTRANSVSFSLIWTAVPILVSVSSFYVYVALGDELTIGTAFTAIALFQMLRGPFNILPTMLVQLLQTKVALDRIATYLDEEEVDEQVSALKRGPVLPADALSDDGLGIINGRFRWNRVRPQSGNTVEHTSRRATGLPHETPTDAGSDCTTTTTVEERVFELRDIDIMFPEGQLTVVTGPTASGKTALLMALLGELTTLAGRIVMAKDSSRVDEHGLTHTLAYAAQSPWLRHQSIKDNILFGHPYDRERYDAVVECCALNPDLAILEDGDETEIGARGVSLSGGQKARVALARAVYAPSKYVLLDDPLSAVDSHTARFLFERLFRGPLLENRTVVLVTHHVELVLSGAYYLIRMLEGRIAVQGTVNDLRASGVLEKVAKLEDHTIDALAEDQTLESVLEADVTETVVNAKPSPDERRKPRKLIEAEQRAEGSVKWPIYNVYLKASSYWTWAIMLVLVILAQILGVGEKLWIKIWGDAYEHAPSVFSLLIQAYDTCSEPGLAATNELAKVKFLNATLSQPFVRTALNLPPASQHSFFYVGIYTAIAVASWLVNISGIITQYTGALRASRILFEKLLQSVVRATMRWHDVTPQGRMLNRFSKDIETLDTNLAASLQSVTWSLATLAVSLLTVIFIFPLFIIPAVILGIFFLRTTILYICTGRDIQRMESNTRSPIFANFSEMLEGIVTVRAFGAERRFLSEMYAQVDLTTRMWYVFWMMNRWVSMALDYLGALTVLATTLFALTGYVDAGLAGVCITSAMAFTGKLYWLCRNWTALEVDLNSVERVVEYLELPQEPPAIIPSRRPPAYWPSSTSPNKDGLLVVEDLVIKYAPDLPEVLHGVSFSLKAKERVGLLGRTGSGKSTLAMSLLRFVDPASGRIVIDGIDISTIGLHDLRSRITFIPQDATLFSGTIRENLDPFGEHTDAECLDVLYRVQLLSDSPLASGRASPHTSDVEPSHDASGALSSASTSSTAADGKIVVMLDARVSPGGANFSQGQRQLIAMARALLRRSAIIILDEATSSIDFATDAKIQATIREEFGDSLLLTVAHRLHTVIDYDRLIVLDNGVVAEFETPLNLLRKEGGIFQNMCQNSGTFAELEAAARAKAEAST
ncbi:multidrug resistance-associated ABC transporter [Trametes elegans]|nr:multidrug resistance-associated ABC transporter [Trametes elegans]